MIAMLEERTEARKEKETKTEQFLEGSRKRKRSEEETEEEKGAN